MWKKPDLNHDGSPNEGILTFLWYFPISLEIGEHGEESSDLTSHLHHTPNRCSTESQNWLKSDLCILYDKLGPSSLV